MSRRTVQVDVVLLDVLTVIGLAVGEAEQTFFQDRVPAIPESNREAELLLIIGDPRKAIFAPAVGAGPRLVMTKVVPRIPVRAVVFANCTPLPFTEIGPPFLPRDTGLTRFIQAFLLIGFGISGWRLLSRSHCSSLLAPRSYLFLLPSQSNIDTPRPSTAPVRNDRSSGTNKRGI